MSWSATARAALTRAFFRSFFPLLLLLASAAQWAVVAWIAVVVGGAVIGWPVHVAAVAGIYAANRAVTAVTRHRRSGLAFRTYTATAFVSLFCAGFLFAAWCTFAVAEAVLGAVSSHALGETGQLAMQSGVGGAFRWVGSLGMAGVALLMGYGYARGQHELVVTRHTIPVRGLRRPLRVVQISDIHVGQNLSVAELERFVARVNATTPDLICITGDIADSPLADMATCFPVLERLRARVAVCAILGNHDHATGAERVVAALRRWTTFHVLRDTAVTLDCGDTALHVIGLDDRGRDWARGVRSDGQLAELLERIPPDAPVLLLAHRPDIFAQAAAVGVPLTLSGHTHGGQLALPWRGGRRRNFAELITEFDRGLYRRGEAYLYVNCGLGVTGQRIRLFTPREISLFELQPAG